MPSLRRSSRATPAPAREARRTRAHGSGRFGRSLVLIEVCDTARVLRTPRNRIGSQLERVLDLRLVGCWRAGEELRARESVLGSGFWYAPAHTAGRAREAISPRTAHETARARRRGPLPHSALLVSAFVPGLTRAVFRPTRRVTSLHGWASVRKSEGRFRMSERTDELLEAVVGLLALSIRKDAQTQAEAIGLFSQAGLKPARIAGLLGTTEATVRSAQQKAQKKAKGSRGAGSK